MLRMPDCCIPYSHDNLYILRDWDPDLPAIAFCVCRDQTLIKDLHKTLLQFCITINASLGTLLSFSRNNSPLPCIVIRIQVKVQVCKDHLHVASIYRS